MRRRHVPNSFTTSGNDQHGSNHMPTEQPYFPTGRAIPPENGPPFVGQMNHMTRSGPPESRVNEYHPSNVGMEIQPYVPPVPPVEPYSHSSITENRSLPPAVHTHSTNYNISSTHDVSNVGPLKRKRSGSFYSAGSSSSSSSQIPIEKDSQGVPHPYRGGPLTIGGEDSDSSRNVRRRYRLDLEPRPHVPTHSSQFYHSTPGQQHNSLEANNGHWNHAPHYNNASRADISGSRNEMNQFHIGTSSADPFFSRHHHVSSSRGPHVPPSTRGDHVVNHSRRAESSYGNSSRYSHYAHGATSSTNGPHVPHGNFSSRNSRHYSHGGWRNSYRSGRPRLAVDRFPPVVHDRMEHETIMMVDRAPFYSSSRSFSDQYRDLRLDIDNMSYEELLNLEERIGNVNTGLSEDSMTNFLREKVHCFLDQNNEEVSCPICLEEYKNGDKIGTMEKCGHDYHMDCIKKWLLMKKLCPICKTECSD